jgi:hypothetical protein
VRHHRALDVAGAVVAEVRQAVEVVVAASPGLQRGQVPHLVEGDPEPIVHVHDPFRGPFAADVADLLEELVVLERRRATGTTVR